MMIELDRVTKRFGTVQALSDVSLQVERGSVYGLVGPNGAGKSTLIRLLAGVFRPDGGEVRVGGERPFDNPGLRARVCCVYDEIYYYMHTTTRDLMKLFRRMYPGFDAERYEKLREVFQEVDEQAPIRNLSRGMQKQSMFWLYFSVCPELLILDEPLDGLDPVMRKQVWTLLMNEVADRSMTVMLSSHNLRELEDVCDHVGILNRGKVLLDRDLSEMQENICKAQMLFSGDPQAALGDLDVIHTAQMGRLRTCIIRGQREVVKERLSAMQPEYLELLPLTLEEIFIYELEDTYAVREILL